MDIAFIPLFFFNPPIKAEKMAKKWPNKGKNYVDMVEISANGINY